MKIKEIEVGHQYILNASKKSRLGCSEEYFKVFLGERVIVLNKLNNFNNKNTVNIQGICYYNKQYELVSFWCSPYDLRELTKSEIKEDKG
jgi:hypothetical protein